MFRRRVLTAVGVVMIAVVFVSAAWQGRSAYAAQTASVGGDALKISPVRYNDITMDPGTTKVVDLYVQNLTDVPTNLHPIVNDFAASTDESGKPSVILDENKYAPGNSFKRLVKPMADFTVAPHDTKDLKVTIVVPKGAAGGGYFGAVRYAPVSSSSDKNVNLTASLGTLFLLRVNGNITEKLSIASFDVRKQPAKQGDSDTPGSFYTDNKKLSVVVRFENGGNVQVAPFGTVLVKKGSKVIDTIQINNKDERGDVLPGSIRRFDAPLNKLGSFGKYTLQGNFGYGANGQLISAQTTLYVVPVFVIVLAIIAIIVLLVLIFVVPRMVRSYNKRVIRKASRRR